MKETLTRLFDKYTTHLGDFAEEGISKESISDLIDEIIKLDVPNNDTVNIVNKAFEEIDAIYGCQVNEYMDSYPDFEKDTMDVKLIITNAILESNPKVRKNGLDSIKSESDNNGE